MCKPGIKVGVYSRSGRVLLTPTQEFKISILLLMHKAPQSPVSSTGMEINSLSIKISKCDLKKLGEETRAISHGRFDSLSH